MQHCRERLTVLTDGRGPAEDDGGLAGVCSPPALLPRSSEPGAVAAVVLFVQADPGSGRADGYRGTLVK